MKNGGPRCHSPPYMAEQLERHNSLGLLHIVCIVQSGRLYEYDHPPGAVSNPPEQDQPIWLQYSPSRHKED